MEVHSSSSGAGSDENLSSSDLSERSGDHEHDYEDIYLVRQQSANKLDQNNNRSQSRDSGSHSRSGSVSSSNSTCNVTVKLSSENVNVNNGNNKMAEVNSQMKNEQADRRVSSIVLYCYGLSSTLCNDERSNYITIFVTTNMLLQYNYRRWFEMETTYR